LLQVANVDYPAGMLLIHRFDERLLASHLAAAAVPDGSAVERVMHDLVARNMAPQDWAPQDLAPQDLAPQDLAPQNLATGRQS
jgi:hypothetical protein